METPASTDVRQTLTCATLATITSLGMFSAVANVMTPLFAGTALLNASTTAQEMRAAYRTDDAECVQTAGMRVTPEFTKLTTI